MARGQRGRSSEGRLHTKPKGCCHQARTICWRSPWPSSGIFTASDDGFVDSIKTLTLDLNVRLVPAGKES